MRKILLLLLLAVCGLGFRAHAVTATDLVGKHCIILVQGTEYGQSGHYVKSFCSEVRASGSNTILLKNFFNKGFDMPLTVSNNTLSIDGSQSYTASDNKVWRFGKRTFVYDNYTDDPSSNYLMPGTAYGFNFSNSISSQTIAKQGESGYVASFVNEGTVSSQIWGSTPWENGFFLWNTSGSNDFTFLGPLHLIFTNYDSKFVETSTNNTKAEYKGTCSITDGSDEDGTRYFALNNIFQIGSAYENFGDSDDGNSCAYTKSLIGKIKPDGTVVIDDSGEIIDNVIDHYYDVVIGGYNTYARYFGSTSGINRDFYDSYGRVLGYVNANFFEVMCSNYSIYDTYFVANTSKANVTGTWKIDPNGTTLHNGNCMWSAKHGGDLDTKMDIIISLGTCGIYDEGTRKMSKTAKSVDIYTTMPYSHEADLSINHVWYESGTGTLNVDLAVTNRINCTHVKSYDLMVMPGKHTDISTFTPHAEKGHPEAIQLVGGIAPMAARSAGDPDVAHAEIARIATPGSDYANAIEKIMAGEHTMFLRTNYTDESGLTPTFHALTTAAVQTGVENLEDIRAEEAVEYYNMQGVRVAAPAPGNTYIRRQGAKAEKIRF